MIIITWLIFCAVIGYMAKNRGRGFWPFALLSAVISPIGGLIVLLVMGKKAPETVESYPKVEQNYSQQTSSFSSFPQDTPAAKSFCPNCGTQVDSEAAFCPNCGKQVNV